MAVLTSREAVEVAVVEPDEAGRGGSLTLSSSVAMWGVIVCMIRPKAFISLWLVASAVRPVAVSTLFEDGSNSGAVYPPSWVAPVTAQSHLWKLLVPWRMGSLENVFSDDIVGVDVEMCSAGGFEDTGGAAIMLGS